MRSADTQDFLVIPFSIFILTLYTLLQAV
jgi:hypothetical protein